MVSGVSLLHRPIESAAESGRTNRPSATQSEWGVGLLRSGNPAIDVKDLARQEGGCRPQEKQNRAADVFDFSDPAQRNALDQASMDLGVVPVGRHARSHHRGRNAVHVDAIARQFDRMLAYEQGKAAFATA